MTTLRKTALRSDVLGRVIREVPSNRLILALTVGVLILLLFLARGFRIQATESSPRGIWQFKDSAIEMGSWVALCPEPAIAEMAKERKYLSRGPCAGNVSPMLKRVVALPGDEVLVADTGVAVSGLLLPRSALLKHDRKGRPLPHPQQGLHTVAAGTLWVINDRADSFDSRYFGPVLRSRVLSVVDAVLVEDGRGDHE